MIRPEDKPEITLVYSKNACNMCRMTKNLLKRGDIKFEEINIENSDEFMDYVDMLKGEQASMSMPVVFPPKSTGLESWSGFQDAKIKELIALNK